MAGRKAVFLDVDGTLVNDAGQVPQSAQQAVQEARANGHLVFLCTGRSLAELWPEILDIGFDGIIAGAGAYVETGGQVLVHHCLAPDDIRHVQDFFGGRDIDFYLQANDGIYGSRRLRSRLRRVIYGSVTDEDVLAELERGLFGFINSIKVDADPFATQITKAIYIDATVGLEEIRTEFAGTFEVIPISVPMFGANSGEMMIPGVHKAAGIDVLIGHLGIDRADTLAIGDNYNDLEMLAEVAIGIAMGNAPEEVRRVANEVTTTPDEDGIRLAFNRHGLIGA